MEIGPRLCSAVLEDWVRTWSSGVWYEYGGQSNSGDAVPEVEMPLDPIVGVMLVLITLIKSGNGTLKAKKNKDLLPTTRLHVALALAYVVILSASSLPWTSLKTRCVAFEVRCQFGSPAQAPVSFVAPAVGHFHCRGKGSMTFSCRSCTFEHFLAPRGYWGRPRLGSIANFSRSRRFLLEEM